MAELSANGRYFRFTAKAWESNGELRVSTADPAFKSTNGIHLTVKRTSKSAQSIRDVADDLGVRWPSRDVDAQALRERIAALSDEELLRVVHQVEVLDMQTD